MNISVLIPVHECNDTVTPLLTNALESIVAQEKIKELPDVYVVHPSTIKDCVQGWKDSMIRKHSSNGINYKKIILLENDGDTDFQSQINFGAKNIPTDYFSILEFDDEYSTTYFHNVLKHVNSEKYVDVDFFLTMLIEVNNENEGQKFTNELVWAQQFVGENGEMGYLNLNAIKQNTDFKIAGGVFKKDEFINVGGLKKNIKLTFNYEFLLRSLNNACRIFIIPKIGYKHMSMREGSLFKHYFESMPMEERRFWFETATKEANFINDRTIDTSGLLKPKNE